MAKNSVNKSALVRDYLAKYPEKGPSAIAQQITKERGVKITGKYVTSVKTKLKQTNGSPAAGSAAPTSAPSPKPATPAKKKAAPASLKSAPTKSAPANGAALSQHIANLKAAAHKLGKDEAKRIIDLF